MSDLLDDYLNEYDPDTNYFDSHISENHVFSSYDSIDDFTSSNQTLLKDSSFISIISQNIRSFDKNKETFLLLFNENSFPDCFIFSETWYDGYEPITIPKPRSHESRSHESRLHESRVIIKYNALLNQNYVKF